MHHHVIAGAVGRGQLFKQTPKICLGVRGPRYTNQHPTLKETVCKIASRIKQASAAGLRMEVALLVAGQIELRVVAFPSWVVAFPSWVVAFPSWAVAFPSLAVALPFLAWVAFASPAFASPALIACQGLP